MLYGYGSAIGAHTKMRNSEKDTRSGKRYGVSLRLLERDREILKEFYRLSERRDIKRVNITTILGKQFNITKQQVRNILRKMRGR